MTRKDYILIAAALKTARVEFPTLEQSKAHDYTARVMADMLQADNARFERVRFLEACGVTP